MGFFDGLIKGVTKAVSANPVGAITTGLGLIDALGKTARGNNTGNQLSKAALEALTQAHAQAGKMDEASLATYRRMAEIARQADETGVYDHEKRTAHMKDQMGKSLANAQGSTANAMTLMGYRPGDTVPMQQLMGLASNYANKTAQFAEQARLEQPMLTMQAYNASNPGAIAALGQQAYNRAVSMAGGLDARAQQAYAGADPTMALAAFQETMAGPMGGATGAPPAPAAVIDTKKAAQMQAATKQSKMRPPKPAVKVKK